MKERENKPSSGHRRSFVNSILKVLLQTHSIEKNHIHNKDLDSIVHNIFPADNSLRTQFSKIFVSY